MTAGYGKIVARLKTVMQTPFTLRTLLSKQAMVSLAQPLHQLLVISLMVTLAPPSQTMNAMDHAIAAGAGHQMTQLSGRHQMHTADASPEMLLTNLVLNYLGLLQMLNQIFTFYLAN
jgi:hypothetical protein